MPVVGSAAFDLKSIFTKTIATKRFISTLYISLLKAFDLFKGIHGLNNHHILIEISEI